MRAKSGKIHRTRRAKVLKSAKGFRGSRSRLYRTAISAVMKAGQHAYNSRRQHKREIRSLWIMRINAAARENNISYSQLVYKLSKAGVTLDRRSLAELAMNEPSSFQDLVRQVS